MPVAVQLEPHRTFKRIFDGTHRSVSESETLQRIEPFCARAGITRVANLTGLDDIGIPVAAAVRPYSRSLSVSQGKGTSLVAAKVSAIMESIEMYHAEHIQVPLRLASYHERSEASSVLDWQQVPALEESLDPDRRMLWAQATSICTGGAVEVPIDLVSLDLRVPLPEGSGLFPPNSNGLASGNTLLEAILHGAWEVIERDSLALFYRRPPRDQSQRRVRLDSLEGSAAPPLLERFERAGVGVALWDISSDVALPAFLCSVVERSPDQFRPVGLARGSGCHPDRDVAMCRAICEAAQSRLTRISGARDDLQAPDLEQIRAAESIARHHLQLTEPELLDFRRVPTRRHATFSEDLEWTVSLLEAAGIPDVLYVDLSRPEFPAHVVKVIIPGLEGPADVPHYRPGPRARALGAAA